MKSILLTLVLSVFTISSFAFVSTDDGGDFSPAELEALRAHSVLDDLESNQSLLESLEEKDVLGLVTPVNRSTSRLSEKYTDRFLAPLVVIINRAPEGTAEDAQTARVYVDGVLQRTFIVSTGKAGYESRIGYFRPVYTNHLRLYDNYYSSKYESLMAKAIFYSGGYAIHHTDALSRLGSRASHGCVRFHIDDITYINDLAMSLGNQNYTRRSWSHEKLPRWKQNNHYSGLARSDVHPINRWTGEVDTNTTITSLDMVILVKDQRDE